jgi:multidrug efflux pump subunit AcrB
LQKGNAPLDAVRKACPVRFRPTMMTTMVAILASVPLVIGTWARRRRERKAQRELKRKLAAE